MAVNPLNAELNPICHLLALLGAHHILHVSRIRVNITYSTIVYFYHDKGSNVLYRNTEASSLDSYCRGKAISITYSECVSLALVIQHAMRMRRITLSSVACLVLPNNFFFTVTHKRNDFQKRIIEYKTRVFIFPKTFLENIEY